MEDNGLIYKESNLKDKRVVKVFLTEKGVELRREVKKAVLSFNEKICERINKKDFEAFSKVTSIIKEQVKEDIEKIQINKLKNNKVL